jgi:hypothetical protein
VRLTSINLNKKKEKEVSVDEMRHFIDILFSSTQGRKVGGVTKMSESVSDGLFPAQDISCFGMKLRRFQSIMSCWEFVDKEVEGIDLSDKYWKTEQLFDRFNKRYASLVLEIMTKILS